MQCSVSGATWVSDAALQGEAKKRECRQVEVNSGSQMLVKKVDILRRMIVCSTANELNFRHLVSDYGSYLTIYILLQCKDIVCTGGVPPVVDGTCEPVLTQTERLLFVSGNFW